MLSITDHVREILSNQPLMEEMLSQNLLNSSQYAKLIRPLIEEKTFKKVEIGSIVTALSRIKDETKKPKNDDFVVDDISIKFPISEISYSINKTNTAKIGQLYRIFEPFENHFLNIVSGNTETSVFVNSKFKSEVLKILGKNTKIIVDNLSLISLKFDPKYLQTIGITYQVLKQLTWNNINLVEIISTFTEIGLIINFSDTNKAFEILNKSFVR